MSIDMYVSSSKSQATSTKQMCRRQIEGCEDLQRQINDFVLNSQSLKGKAYDSARSYYGRVLYPLTRGCILLSEAVDQAVSRFPNEYQSRVDHGDLSELDLERKIEDAKRLLNQAQRIADQISNSSLPDIMKQQDEVENRLLMNSCQTTLNKLQEQLRKLRAFNASSPSIFSEIDGLKQAVNQGLAQTKSSFNIVTGTFIISKDLSWANKINSKWRDYETRNEDEITIKKVQYPNGMVLYQVYRNGKFDQTATADLAIEIAQEKIDLIADGLKNPLQTLKSFGDGFSNEVLENNYLKGFVKFDPDEISKRNIGYKVGTFAGDLFSLFQAGAEIAGGTIAKVGGNIGGFGAIPVTGGASVAAIPVADGISAVAWSHGVAVGGMTLQQMSKKEPYRPKQTIADNMRDFLKIVNLEKKLIKTPPKLLK